MYQSLDLFRTAGAMASHAGARQAVVARNMANADTPGYQAQALPSFRDAYRASDNAALRATRPAHIGGVDQTGLARVRAAGAEPAPNGNAVSVEEEMLRGVEAQREHSRALAIYRHSMTVLRSVLGR